MTGEPTDTASEMALSAPSYINYHLKSEVSNTLHCQLCSTLTQHFESRTGKAPLQSTYTERKKWCHVPQFINYCLKYEHPLLFVVGYVQPVTQQYESRTVRKATLQPKQPLLKIPMISITKGSHHVLSPNLHTFYC